MPVGNPVFQRADSGYLCA